MLLSSTRMLSGKFWIVNANRDGIDLVFTKDGETGGAFGKRRVSTFAGLGHLMRILGFDDDEINLFVEGGSLKGSISRADFHMYFGEQPL